MSAPILTIGDLEPERPTIAIKRSAPDGAWQRFKHRHFDTLLRWFPVRFAYHEDQYPLHYPSEFGLRARQRLSNMQKEIAQLEAAGDPASERRLVLLIRHLVGMLLDAPGDVLDALTTDQQLQVVRVFPSAVMGKAPRTPTPPAAVPSTSDDSSPASAGSTPATVGRTG